MQNKFTIDSIGDVALGLGIAIIVVAVVGMILATFIPSTYVNTAVANATFDNTTTLTVSHGLVSWDVYNDTTQNYELPATNYTVNTTTGALNITDATARLGGDESVSYVYSGNSNATTIVGKGLTAISGFADWFAIIVIVVVAVIILTLVMLLRGRGGGRE